jgi:hypothetical protein
MDDYLKRCTLLVVPRHVIDAPCNEAAWAVRDDALVGYAVILDADNDALGALNALRVAQIGLFGSTPVFSVPLPFDLKPGTWHAVQTIAAGSQVSVYVDGQLIARFEVAGHGFPLGGSGLVWV